MKNPYKEQSSVNPQKEKGHRRIANDVFKAIIQAKLSGGEYQRGDFLTETLMRVCGLYDLLKKLVKWEREEKLRGHLNPVEIFLKIEVCDESIIEEIEKTDLAIDIIEKEINWKWKERSKKCGLI